MANINWRDKLSEVCELWEAGLTAAEIGTIYGANARTVQNMLTRYNIRPPSTVARNTKPRWAKHRAELEQMAADGLGLRVMADHFGVSVFAVGSALKRMGIKMTEEGKKARQRERMKAVHENPKHREAWISKVIENNKNTKRRELHRAQMKRQWQDPEYRKRISDKMREYYATNPEYRAKVADGARKGGAAFKAKLEYEKKLAAMTPFERQLELVRSGKLGVVRKERMPSAADPTFTAGGVTPYE